MKRLLVLLSVLACASSAFGQTSRYVNAPTVGFAQTGPGFGLGVGWDLPQTPAIAAVAQAIQRGLCDQAAVDFIASLGQPIASSPAPLWPMNRHQPFWYGKGEGCSGKFEFVGVKDGGGDQGYVDGWEISWEPASYVPGIVPGLPTGDGTQHPTRWRFVPITPWQGGAPTPQPPPGGGGPNPPSPAPVPTPPPVDLAPVLAAINALTNEVGALSPMVRSILATEENTNQQVTEMNKSMSDYVVPVFKFAMKYVVPAIGAWFAAKHLG